MSDQSELTVEHVSAAVTAATDHIAEDLHVPSFAAVVDEILAPLYQDVADEYLRFALQRGGDAA